MRYPFTPKSTVYLEPGQFWSIPLSDGRYACGIVLAQLGNRNRVEKRIFYAALLDWVSEVPPNEESINNPPFVKKGALHIKGISSIDSKILGKAVIQGLPESPVANSDDIVTMAYNVLNRVAEDRFVKQNS